MMGIIGLLIAGLIFYLVFKFFLEEDRISSGSGENSQVAGNEPAQKKESGRRSDSKKSSGNEKRPHPLRDKFSGRVREEEIIELARRRLESGQISRQEFEDLKENIELSED